MNEVQVTESGEAGPRLLLLPGLGARGAGFRPLEALLGGLARTVRVEYPDGAAAGVGAGRLAEQVQRAVGDVDGVVASSFGGMVGAHLVARGGARGIAFVGSFSTLQQLGFRGPLIRLMGPLAVLGHPGSVAAAVAARSLIPRQAVPDIVPTTLAEQLGVFHRSRSLPGEPPPPLLRDLAIACTAMHGDRDLLVPVKVLSRLLAELPAGTRGHVISGAGHVPYFTHPAQVATILRPWIEALGERCRKSA